MTRPGGRSLLRCVVRRSFRLRQTVVELDLRAIASTSGTRAQAATKAFAKAAQAGWEGRADKAEAWAKVRVGEAALASFTAARQIQGWVEGGWGRRPEVEVRVPDVSHLPPDAAAVGCWLALELFLTPGTTWLHMPAAESVTWPADVGELVVRAFPESGERYIGLRERGVHATKR